MLELQGKRLFSICAGHANDRAGHILSHGLDGGEQAGDDGGRRAGRDALVPCARYANSTRQPQPRQPSSSWSRAHPRQSPAGTSHSRAASNWCLALIMHKSTASYLRTHVSCTHARTPSRPRARRRLPTLLNPLRPSCSTNKAPGVMRGVKDYLTRLSSIFSP